MSVASDPFAQKVCVVTGANRGIGLQLVEALLRQQAHVHAGCRTPQKAEALQALQRKYPETLQVQPLDVTSDASVKAFAETLPEGIDVLINNAGIMVDSTADGSRLDATKLQQSFDTNTSGPLRMVQATLPKLHRRHCAKVANISSIMGSIAENGTGGNIAYRASKTALNMVNKCWALQERNTIFLVLHPGWVKTDMGGVNAQVDSDQSAAGLLQVIAQATLESSGGFFRFDGQRAPW